MLSIFRIHLQLKIPRKRAYFKAIFPNSLLYFWESLSIWCYSSVLERAHSGRPPLRRRFFKWKWLNGAPRNDDDDGGCTFSLQQEEAIHMCPDWLSTMLTSSNKLSRTFRESSAKECDLLKAPRKFNSEEEGTFKQDQLRRKTGKSTEFPSTTTRTTTNETQVAPSQNRFWLFRTRVRNLWRRIVNPDCQYYSPIRIGGEAQMELFRRRRRFQKFHSALRFSTAAVGVPQSLEVIHVKTTATSLSPGQ